MKLDEVLKRNAEDCAHDGHCWIGKTGQSKRCSWCGASKLADEVKQESIQSIYRTSLSDVAEQTIETLDQIEAFHLQDAEIEWNSCDTPLSERASSVVTKQLQIQGQANTLIDGLSEQGIAIDYDGPVTTLKFHGQDWLRRYFEEWKEKRIEEIH